jgi:hypothetical protein
VPTNERIDSKGVMASPLSTKSRSGQYLFYSEIVKPL